MLNVDEILVADDIVSTSFACNLAKCRGECCVQGESGAPLEEDEPDVLERVLPLVRKYLSREARKVIEIDGVWERLRDGRLVTTCVGDAECVFVTREGGVAKCSIQKAYEKGETDFPKPISCHLFPVRITSRKGIQMLNYEVIDICGPARSCGARDGIALSDFLRVPLTRKYGREWYSKFKKLCAQERDRLSATTAS